MGLFGELDANDVSDDPFYVAPDVYTCVLTDLAIRESRAGGKFGLSFSWTIEEDDSEFDGNNISEWVNVYLDSEMEEEAGSVVVRRDRARLKQRLFQIGMSAEEMNELVGDDSLINEDIQAKYIGTMAYVEIVETEGRGANEGRVFTNVKKVSLPGE